MNKIYRERVRAINQLDKVAHGLDGEAAAIVEQAKDKLGKLIAADARRG